METLSASHHWSQLRALHPDLLQVTWSPHRVPAGLLTWVSAVCQITKGDIKTLSFISYHVLCFFFSLCLPAGCNCQSEFTDGTCEDRTGRCFCKPNYSGENCDSCASGFVNFPDCYRESQRQTHWIKTVWASEFYVPKHLNPHCYVEIKNTTLCVRQPSPRIPPTTTTARPNQQARSSVRLYFYFIFNFIYLGVASCCCFWILD